MTRRSFFFLLPSPLLLANRANGDPRLEELYGQFMSPCCWAETLLIHSSPIADQMRGEIQKWVAEGKTDEQIKSIFVQRYTMRILSMPEGARLQWLYWTPVAALFGGLAALAIAVRKLKAAPQPNGSIAGELPDVDVEWDAS